jgi:hypothetical protein
MPAMTARTGVTRPTHFVYHAVDELFMIERIKSLPRRNAGSYAERVAISNKFFVADRRYFVARNLLAGAVV